MDVLFEIEREINGDDFALRHRTRQEQGVPLIAFLENWLRSCGRGSSVRPRGGSQAG
jgi:hypothetical protein